MVIFKKINNNNYALWLGDNINKKLNISTKSELALKIYKELNEDIKKNVESKEKLTEVSQVFLDSITGNMMNLISLLEDELELEDKYNPYSYLSKIGVIDTVITHDHSKILESIWKDGEIHNIFCEKKIMESNVNLFKILGDYGHTERIILTSQNMRKVKKLKLYDHFWEKLSKELKDKNLILLGVNLDEDTKDVLTMVFSKINLSNIARYFVTSSSISMEDESWLISNEFEFIYEDDLNFIKKMALYFNNENIDFVEEEAEIDMIENIKNIQTIEIEETKEVEENKEIKDSELESEKIEESLEKISESKEEKQLKIFEKEDISLVDEKKDNLINSETRETETTETETTETETITENTFEAIEEKYIVENLKILMYLDEKTLKGEIIETEFKNRQRRLTEFREKRSPSYKIDDFSEINHYKALDIKIPFEYNDFPQMKLEKKIFSGKTNIRCNDQVIYNVAVRSYMSGKYQVIDFKDHDFYLKFLLEDDSVINFAYKISENTVNIKGRNIYIFFKNLFGGFELNFKNKKISGNFKIVSDEDVERLDIILDTIDRYLSIKKQIKTRDVSLKELLKNTRSLEVLFSYYNNTPKITSGNITIRTDFIGNIDKIEKLLLSYPVSVNFLGFIRSFIESTEIEIDSLNMSYSEGKLEIQAFNIIQNITYKEIID